MRITRTVFLLVAVMPVMADGTRDSPGCVTALWCPDMSRHVELEFLLFPLGPAQSARPAWAY